MIDHTTTMLFGGSVASPEAGPDLPGVEVIGAVLSGNEVIARVLAELPAVLVLDSEIAEPDARAVCRRIREWAPATKVLTVSPADDEAAYTTVVAGAAGSVTAHAAPGEVAEAAVAIARGESLLQPRMARRLLHDIDSWAQRSADPLHPPPTLTATEREVLVGLGAGQTPLAIAATHAVTPHLVNLHAGFAVAKLHRYVLGTERIASSDH